MRAILRFVPLAAVPAILMSCGPRSAPEGEKGTLAQRLDQDAAVSAIFYKWLGLVAAGVPIGSPSGNIITAPGDVAKIQLFQQGVIVYSDDFGAVFLTHALFERWLYYQTMTVPDGSTLYSYLGVPVRDWVQSNGHKDAHFERGMIVDGNINNDMYAVYGEFYLRYLDLMNVIGQPTEQQGDSPGGGRAQKFQFGELHQGPAGTFVLIGDVVEKWKALGAGASWLGHPMSDNEAILSNGGLLGRSAHFEHGAVYFNETAGTWAVEEGMLGTYEKNNGGAAGWLGFPIADPVVTSAGDHYTDFQNGVIVDRRQDPLKGVYAYQNADIFLKSAEGTGCDTTLCNDQDIFVDVLIHKDFPPNDILYNERIRPPSDRAFWEINKPYPISGVLRGTTRVTVDVDVYDDDDDDFDHLGKLLRVYTIDNLWGLTLNDHQEQGQAKADFSMRKYFPYDRNDVRGQLWWSFHNFNTEELSYDTFAETFEDVGPDEALWRHPFNKIYYALYKGLASNGNCFGMSVESIYAKRQRSLYPEPIHQFFADTQDGKELVSDNGGPHSSLMHVLNVKHGYQMGEDAIKWMVDYFRFTRLPGIGAVKTLQMLSSGDYPVISVSEDVWGGSAHTVLPYAVVPGGTGIPGQPCLHTPPLNGVTACQKILIADPNFPTGQAAQPQGAIEIDMARNHWYYENKKDGGTTGGGYLFVIPAHTFNKPPHTLVYSPSELVKSGVVIFTGDNAQVAQISDDTGHSLVKSGVPFPPSKWSDFRPDDDPAHMVNFAPIPSFDGKNGEVHVFAGFGATAASHTYQFTPKPGTAEGTPYEVTFDSGKMAAHFIIPSTPGVVETFHARSINTPDKAIAIDAASGAPPKPITWIVAGADKKRWIECSQMTLNPSQKLTARLENAGTKLILENDGPPTSCDARLQNGGATPIALGLMEIPSGVSQLSTLAPVTTLQVTGGTLGQNGWYVAPPTVTLTAQDLGGQGIQAIEYSFDQTNWTPYTVPFAYPQEGATVLYYRTRDNAGTQEPAKSRPFQLDTQRPSATGTVGTTGGVTLNYTATDPTPGSGVAGVYTIVRGAGGSPSQSFNAGISGVLTLPTTCSAVEFWSQDVAGNEQSPHAVVGDTVAPTFTSVPAAVVSTKCTGAAGLSIGTATATDDCGTVTITNNAPATFPLGTTTVVWTARDAAGNTTTATQLVTTSLLDSASCCPAGTNVIMGTAGADTILGTAGNDCILGLGGNDTIAAQGGNDYISGGPGNDTISAGAGNDWVWGGDGNDTIDGSTGDDFVHGGAGTNTCAGGAGVNSVVSCQVTSGCTAACCSTNTCGP